MGELGLNKIMGALLATALFLFGLNEVANAVFGGGGHHETHEYASLNDWAKESFHGYRIDIADTGGGPVEEEDVFDLGLVLASADIAAGETAMRQCVQCHTWDEGGANGTGPNLYAMMGRDIASVDGFAYSGALSGVDGVWTYEAMNEWLTNPGAFARGNKMAFAGLRSPRKDAERANIIAFLASVTPNAPAFPSPLTVDAAVEAAEGGFVEEVGADGASDDAETISGDAALDPATDAANVVAEAAVETANEAIDAATDGAEAATDGVIDTVTEATDDTVDNTLQVIEEAAEDAAETAEDLVDQP